MADDFLALHPSGEISHLKPTNIGAFFAFLKCYNADMLTFEVEIVDPKAEAALRELESEKRIKLTKIGEKPRKNGAKEGEEKKPLQFGSMKGLVLYMADDFDAPLEDFEDYM